jgi:hypothetical protein
MIQVLCRNAYFKFYIIYYQSKLVPSNEKVPKCQKLLRQSTRKLGNHLFIIRQMIKEPATRDYWKSRRLPP